VGSQRLAKCEAHEGSAVGDFGGGALELRVGQEHEPGSKRGAVRFVREADLRRGGARREHEDEDEAARERAGKSRWRGHCGSRRGFTLV
jgi:hypothetical protein